MIEIELLPCPCCGGKAKICQWRDTERPNATWVECENCGLQQDSFHHEDADHIRGIAAMMWNTRIPPDALAEAVKALEAYANPNVWECLRCSDDCEHTKPVFMQGTAFHNGYEFAQQALQKLTALDAAEEAK